MIFQKGHLAPSKQHLLEAKKNADESFCVVSSAEFLAGCPQINGWVPAERGATLLTLKNVEPHEDPWVGMASDEHDFDGPKNRRALFWVLAVSGHAVNGHIHFQCGRKAERLAPGDWVVFDDRIMHSVITDRKWYGAASQLMERK